MLGVIGVVPGWSTRRFACTVSHVVVYSDRPVSDRFSSLVSVMLVLGDSYAFWLHRHIDAALPVASEGIRGGCIGEQRFRRWAVQAALRHRARVVLIIAGGNDLARPACNPRDWLWLVRGLTGALLAAGVERVHLLPVPPRSRLRPGDATARQYRRRRWLANRLLTDHFRGAPAEVLPFTPSPDFLGRDGVHPSPAGWRALEDVIKTVLAAADGALPPR